MSCVAAVRQDGRLHLERVFGTHGDSFGISLSDQKTLLQHPLGVVPLLSHPEESASAKEALHLIAVSLRFRGLRRVELTL